MIDANNYLEIWKRKKSGHSKSITRPLPLRRIAHVRICFLYDLEQKERYILFINFPQNMYIHLLLPLNNLICNLIVFVLLRKVYHSLCQNEFSTLKIMKNKKCPAKGNSKPSRQWCLGDYPSPLCRCIHVALMSQTRTNHLRWFSDERRLLASVFSELSQASKMFQMKLATWERSVLVNVTVCQPRCMKQYPDLVKPTTLTQVSVEPFREVPFSSFKKLRVINFFKVAHVK